MSLRSAWSLPARRMPKPAAVPEPVLELAAALRLARMLVVRPTPVALRVLLRTQRATRPVMPLREQPQPRIQLLRT